MTGAIFGLLGVIVGGVLTGAVEAFRESRSQRALSLAAARLLSAELSVQETILLARAQAASAEPQQDRMLPPSAERGGGRRHPDRAVEGGGR